MSGPWWGALLVYFVLACAGCSRAGPPRWASATPEHPAGPGPQLVVQRGHSGHVNDLSFSADGRFMVTGSDDGTIKLWDVGTGQIRATLGGFRSVDRVVFGPGDHLVAAGGTIGERGIVRVWATATGQLLTSLEHGESISDLEFGPNGRTLLTTRGFGDHALLWDVQTGRILRKFKGGEQAALSPDGRTMVSSSGLSAWAGRAWSWDIDAGKPLARSRARVRMLSYWVHHRDSWSPDRKTLLVEHNDGLGLLDMESGTLRASISLEGLTGVAHSPKGDAIATVTKRGDLQIWNSRTGVQEQLLRGRDHLSDGIGSVDYAPGGTSVLVTDGDDKVIVLWDLESDEQRQLVHQGVLSTDSFSDSAMEVVRTSFSPDGTLLAIARRDYSVMVWDVARDELRWLCKGSGASTGVAVLDDSGENLLVIGYPAVVEGSWIAPERASAAYVWNLDSLEMQSRAIERMAPVLLHSVGALFGPEGQPRVARLGRHAVEIEDFLSPASDRADTTIDTKHDEFIFGPRGELLWTYGQYARYSESESSIWRVESGQVQATLELPIGVHIRKMLAFSPDATAVAASHFSARIRSRRRWDDMVAIWDTGTGQLRTIVDPTERWVYSAAFSPDGTMLATGGDSAFVELWDAKTGVARARIETHTPTASLAFGPGGQYLAVGGMDGRTELWDVISGVHRASVRGIGPAKVLIRRGPTHGTTDDDGSAELELITSGDVLSFHRFDDEWNPSTLHVEVLEEDDQTQSRLVYTDNGLFTGDEQAFDEILYRIGPNLLEDDLATPDRLFDYFYRSSIVSDFRRGYPMELPVEAAEGVGPPPSVELLDIPTGPVLDDVIEVRVRATSRGGGVANIQLYNNGSRVNNPTTRGVERVARSEFLERRFMVKLQTGVANELRAHAFSELGRVRGDDATAVVQHGGDPVRPNLHLLVVSLERYTDPALRLWAPHEDAAAIIGAFQLQEGRLYGSVTPIHLQDGGATLEGIDRELVELADRTEPEDVFVLYFAGHGIFVECEQPGDSGYYLLTYRANFGSSSTICREGLGMSRLAERLQQIESNKKLLIFDACGAGSATRESTLLTIRGAKEDEAILRLARSEGLAILAGSKADQAAYEENRLGYGLFSYVLLRGLEGNSLVADESVVTVSSLMSYVGNHLPRVSRTHGVVQEPSYSLQGMDFPLFAVRVGDQLVEAVDPGAALEASDLSDRVDERIAEHVQTQSRLILDCLGREEAVVIGRVQRDGAVVFSAHGVRLGSAEDRCMQRAIPNLTVEASAGESRVPLRLR